MARFLRLRHENGNLRVGGTVTIVNTIAACRQVDVRITYWWRNEIASFTFETADLGEMQTVFDGETEGNTREDVGVDGRMLLKCVVNK
jgi:hypothetical protein